MKRKWTENIVNELRVERYRQISDEEWSPAHDDEHKRGEMALAAGCYAANAAPVSSQWMRESLFDLWPWDREWWKPTSARRDLVKAGALIIAELERVDRASALQRQKEPT